MHPKYKIDVEYLQECAEVLTGTHDFSSFVCSRNDIDDAVRAGVISEDDIPLEIRKALGYRKSIRINNMVLNVVENSVDDIVFSPEVQQPFDELHAFMFDKVYTNPVCKGEETKAMDVIIRLYDYLLQQQHTHLIHLDVLQYI